MYIYRNWLICFDYLPLAKKSKAKHKKGHAKSGGIASEVSKFMLLSSKLSIHSCVKRGVLDHFF